MELELVAGFQLMPALQVSLKAPAIPDRSYALLGRLAQKLGDAELLRGEILIWQMVGEGDLRGLEDPAGK